MLVTSKYIPITRSDWRQAITFESNQIFGVDKIKFPTWCFGYTCEGQFGNTVPLTYTRFLRQKKKDKISTLVLRNLTSKGWHLLNTNGNFFVPIVVFGHEYKKKEYVAYIHKVLDIVTKNLEKVVAKKPILEPIIEFSSCSTDYMFSDLTRNLPETGPPIFQGKQKTWFKATPLIILHGCDYETTYLNSNIFLSSTIALANSNITKF